MTTTTVQNALTAGTNDYFTLQTVKTIIKLAKERDTLTTDDVWAALPKNATTPEPRAMGGIMVECARAGVIKRTDRVVKSTREVCHRRPIAVWESLVKGK